VFGRSSPPEAKPFEPAKPASPGFPPPISGTMAPAPAAAAASTLGSDLAIVGQQVTIISQSRLVIDGQVRGDVNGREIVVGENGRVAGTIVAQSVEVRGTVTGAIKGSTVTLMPTARVDGDITKMSLIISEGAHLDGNVRRAKDQSEVTPNLTVPA
jgi:cytoskeletal protein CcmA (bactofilin family)